MNQSAIRTPRLIELLAQRGSLSLAAIASSLELNKSTAHRSTNTLLRAGHLRQDPQTRMYALTMKIVGLASQVLDGVDVARETHAVLEETAPLTQVTAHLGVLENREVVFIDKFRAGRSSRWPRASGDARSVTRPASARSCSPRGRKPSGALRGRARSGRAHPAHHHHARPPVRRVATSPRPWLRGGQRRE